MGADTEVAMKILITTDLYEPLINGVVSSIVNLRGELENLGHEVRVLTVSNDKTSHCENHVYYMSSLPLGFVYPNIRFPVKYGGTLIEEIIRWNPDIVHSPCEFFSFGLAQKVVSHTHTPMVHTYHTLYEQYMRYLLGGRIMPKGALPAFTRKRLRHVSAIIAPTKKVMRTLRSYGVTNPVTVIPTGIDLSVFYRSADKKVQQELRDRLKIPAHHKIILNLGRLGFEKNLSELLYYFKDFLRIQPDVTFLIVGGGPAKESLQQLAAELQISDHVVFTGMVLPEQVPDYYQLGDVFVCASTSETQGLTYIEAAASGLPLVCRADSCLEGVLEHGKNGFIYTDRKNFCRYVSAALYTEKWRKIASGRSRQISLLYGREQFGLNMESLYIKILKEKAVKNHESFDIFQTLGDSDSERRRQSNANAGRIAYEK